MKYSLSLGSFKGIKVWVHWTFLLLIAFVVFREMGRGSDLPTIITTVIFVFGVFACVVLHEFGHALTAMRYGIKTSRITLLPIGGLASLEKMPDNPKQEFWVAVAGPAVNVVIALILYLIFPINEFFENPPEVAKITPGNFFIFLFITNIFLVVFNIIPAFPMDGGRIFRSLLAIKIGRPKATQIAANLGQFIAVLFFFLGLFGNPILVLIGIFVFFGAYSENMMVQQLDMLKGYKVGDAMMTEITTLTPEDTVDKAVKKLLAGSEQDFIVTDEEGNVIGIVTRDLLIGSIHKDTMQQKVGEIMNKDFETLNTQDKLKDIYMNLQRTQHIFFPVMENGEVKGAINRENLNEFLMIQTQMNY